PATTKPGSAASVEKASGVSARVTRIESDSVEAAGEIGSIDESARGGGSSKPMNRMPGDGPATTSAKRYSRCSVENASRVSAQIDRIGLDSLDTAIGVLPYVSPSVGGSHRRAVRVSRHREPRTRRRQNLGT